MISVVVPVYNEEKSIKNTINEIKKVLKTNKLYKNSEIIIVNDGSTDNTLKELKKCDVVIINNPTNMGYGFSLKRGIEAAKNETIVITDADSTYPFDAVPKMLEVKNKGFDLVVGKRKGKYYRQSIFKSILRLMLKKFVEFISGKKIDDINSGLRIFDKSLVMKYFPRLCNTFSFTTSQTLAYLMNNHFVTYVDINYNKRKGKSKVKLLRDSMIALRYILESCVYYNPLKVFTLLSVICIFLSIIGFLFSHFANIHAGYILGIGGLLLSIVVFSFGLLAVILKQIMDKQYDNKDN
jgi:glycosyltransferase involved in cell wall biosynthesis